MPFRSLVGQVVNRKGNERLRELERHPDFAVVKQEYAPDEVVRMYQDQVPHNLICLYSGMPSTAVYRLLDAAGVPRNKRVTKEDEDRIAQMYKSGMLGREIAAKIGCPRHVVYQIANRRGVYKYKTRKA